MEFEYTVDSTGVRREIHKLNCPCDLCEERRVITLRWRDGEAEDQNPKLFEGLTEQERYDLHRKHEELHPQYGAIHPLNPQNRFRW